MTGMINHIQNMVTQSYGMVTEIPSAYDVNYADAAEVCGYQLLLCKMFEWAGGFSGPGAGTNGTIRTVRKEGLVWLREVRRIVESILEAPVRTEYGKTGHGLGDIPGLLSSYDMFHRICNGGPCFDYLRNVRQETAMRWIRGDRSISMTDVALLLLQEVNRDNRTLERRYSDFCIGVMGKWIDELTKFGRFRNTPYPEALRRLGYLLDDDLFVYLGSREQRRIKVRWTDAYAVDDFTALDTPTLLEYIGFIRTATRRKLYHCDNDDEQYISLWSEYASRPEVNRFAREASAIDIEIRQTMLTEISRYKS